MQFKKKTNMKNEKIEVILENELTDTSENTQETIIGGIGHPPYTPGSGSGGSGS